MSRKPVSRKPQQERSQRTLDRMLQGMESLLAERDAADITVEDIVERADTSTGAFYKRFNSKHDVLPLLLARLQQAAHRDLNEALQSPRWNACGLGKRIAALVEMIADAQIQRQRIIRALVAARMTATLQMSEEDMEQARAMMDAMRDWLLERRSEIRHPDPERAVRLGLFLVLNSLQSALLFETLPQEVTKEHLIEEAKRMLIRYLRDGEQ